MSNCCEGGRRLRSQSVTVPTSHIGNSLCRRRDRCRCARILGVVVASFVVSPHFLKFLILFRRENRFQLLVSTLPDHLDLLLLLVRSKCRIFLDHFRVRFGLLHNCLNLVLLPSAEVQLFEGILSCVSPFFALVFPFRLHLLIFLKLFRGENRFQLLVCTLLYRLNLLILLLLSESRILVNRFHLISGLLHNRLNLGLLFI